MRIDVDVPNPPDLTNRGVPALFDAVESVGSESDLRREELERILQDGAWREGFEEWAQYTELSDAEVQRVEEARLFGEFDFFWDPDATRLRYSAPAVPSDWAAAAAPGDVSADVVSEELDDLGRTVAETIATDYVDWGEARPSDLVWDVETFGQVPSGEVE